MINQANISSFAIISDFDGTISTKDSNDLLFKTLGNEKNHEIEERYKAGEIGVKDGLTAHFCILELTLAEYGEFISENIELDKSFASFYKKIREIGLSFSVVSGGFKEGILLVFSNAGLKPPKIFANSLSMQDGRLKPSFINERMDCEKPFGVCGNCKEQHINRIKANGKKVIFIGDGLTDRCCAKCADYLFAKSDLAHYCSELKIPYIGYDNFNDISAALFGKIYRYSKRTLKP